MSALDPARLAIFDSLVSSAAEEMGATLRHTALSPNIKERQDFSCAVFDADGQLLAQAAHIPVHLGAMPESVRAVESLAPWTEGDIAILNDPYLGGTHLPDVTMVSPVFAEEGPRAPRGPSGRRAQPIGFVASRAHQADIGGSAPGSMPVARELIQEGMVIPPVRIYRAGELVEETLALVLRNVRTPDERRGDFAAQVAAQRVGGERLRALAGRLGLRQFRRSAAALLDYGERIARATIATLPNGSYRFEDAMDDDGFGDGPLPIVVELAISGRGLHLDFSGTAPQRPASINAVAAVTRSASYYVLRCLLPPGAPTNAGLFRPFSFTLPEASLVNARPPVAVNAGNVETSQRIVDTVWGALSQALPERMPAASSGTMNNLTAGGIDPSNGRPVGLLRDHRRRARRRPGRPRPRGGAQPHDEHAQHPRRGARAGLPAARRRAERAPRQRRRGTLRGRRRHDPPHAVPRRRHRDDRQRAPHDPAVGRTGRPHPALRAATPSNATARSCRWRQGHVRRAAGRRRARRDAGRRRLGRARRLVGPPASPGLLGGVYENCVDDAVPLHICYRPTRGREPWIARRPAAPVVLDGRGRSGCAGLHVADGVAMVRVHPDLPGG